LHPGKAFIPPSVLPITGDVDFVKNRRAGWLSYLWPKPGAEKPSEKICYLLKVPDTNVFLVAGFYINKWL
jgi:signal transduction histidine kinase